ncbi:hypothetical protein LCGC14_2914520, partial [marine sediment metagenome]
TMNAPIDMDGNKLLNLENVGYGIKHGLFWGTFDFNETDIGDEPLGWTPNNSGGCTTTIIDSFDGHVNVLQLNDSSGAGIAAINSPTFTQGLDSTIELWIAKSSISSNTILNIYIQEGSTYLTLLQLEGNDLHYFAGSFISIKNDFLLVNSLVHIKIVLNDTANTFDCYINETLEGSGLPYENNSTSGLNNIYFSTDAADTGYIAYIDAIGVSTDTRYNVGDNYTPLINNDGIALQPTQTLSTVDGTDLVIDVDISFNGGQLFDGQDVSALAADLANQCTTAEAHAYVEANALTLTQNVTFNAGQLFDGQDVSALATDLGNQATAAEAHAYVEANALTLTNALAMGTNKITGLGNGANPQDAMAFGQKYTNAEAVQAAEDAGLI